MLHPSLPSQTGIRSTIAGLAAACILCGCSSRIYTTLSEAGAPLPADSVRLFTEDLPRPAASRKIGELTISSSSENADERNREAVDLAVRATAGIGGDALSVTEQNETATSNGTTYTLSADLLRIDGRDTSATMRFDPPLRLRSKHPAKVIRRMNDRQRNRLPRHLFYGSAGAGFVISDPYTIDGAPYDGSTAGIAYNAGYDYCFARGFTLGLRYACFRMKAELSIPHPIAPISSVLRCNIGTHYAAPEAGYSFRVGNKFMFSALAGIGYVNYFERMEGTRFSLDGFGTHGIVRATLLLSKRLDIGAEVGGYSSYFTSSALETADFDGHAGIKYVSIAMGLHLHF